MRRARHSDPAQTDSSLVRLAKRGAHRRGVRQQRHNAERGAEGDKAVSCVFGGSPARSARSHPSVALQARARLTAGGRQMPERSRRVTRKGPAPCPGTRPAARAPRSHFGVGGQTRTTVAAGRSARTTAALSAASLAAPACSSPARVWAPTSAPSAARAPAASRRAAEAQHKRGAAHERPKRQGVQLADGRLRRVEGRRGRNPSRVAQRCVDELPATRARMGAELRRGLTRARGEGVRAHARARETTRPRCPRVACAVRVVRW